MNDWGNILLRDEIVRFQADTTRNEAIYMISPTGRTRQRTLQALAHSLDLDYEYSVREQLARITKPVISSSEQESILDPNMSSLSSFTDNFANDDYLTYTTSGADCASIPSIASDQFHSVNPPFGNDQNLYHDIAADPINWDALFDEEPLNVLDMPHPSGGNGDDNQVDNARMQYQPHMTHLPPSLQTVDRDNYNRLISAADQLLLDKLQTVNTTKSYLPQRWAGH